MKGQIHYFYASFVVFALFLLSACETHKYAGQADQVKTTATQPRFMDGIYLGHHGGAQPVKPTVAIKRSPLKVKMRQQVPEAEEETMEGEPIQNTSGATVALGPLAGIDAYAGKYAPIVGVEVIDNLPMYRFIDKWYGTAYKLGGCDMTGVDCSGFAQKLYEEVYGINLVRTAMEQFKDCVRIRHSGDAEEGDLVFFKVHSRHITHVGVYLANDHFVHASSSQGVVISSLGDQYWRKYYAGCGRVPRG